MERLIEPRCPSCGKKLQEWLEGKGGYRCRGCGFKFELDTDNLPKSYHFVKKA